MSIFQDLRTVPKSRLFQDVKVWVKQLFVLCLMGMAIAIVKWQETGIWLALLSLVVSYALVLVIGILRAVKFLEEEENEHENQNVKAVDSTS